MLSKLNFSIPDDVIRQVVQCRPGMVEQVLLLLRQKMEEKQKQSKVVSGAGQVSRAWGKRRAWRAMCCWCILCISGWRVLRASSHLREISVLMAGGLGSAPDHLMGVIITLHTSISLSQGSCYHLPVCSSMGRCSGVFRGRETPRVSRARVGAPHQE